MTQLVLRLVSSRALLWMLVQRGNSVCMKHKIQMNFTWIEKFAYQDMILVDYNWTEGDGLLLEMEFQSYIMIVNMYDEIYVIIECVTDRHDMYVARMCEYLIENK